MGSRFASSAVAALPGAALPPVKIHCSILAEDAIKAAVNDYKAKTGAGAAADAKAH